MSERDSFPDEVPVADASEQERPLSEPDAVEIPVQAEAPLEASASDWQDQHRVVEIDDDDFR